LGKAKTPAQVIEDGKKAEPIIISEAFASSSPIAKPEIYNRRR